MAAAAAAALRGGRHEPDAARAAKHLRVLLAADAVAIVESGADRVALDGAETLTTSARRVAARVYESGRRQVFTEQQAAAVGAPIIVDGRVWGAVVAFAADVRAPLVRATGDVADWCAAQIELAGLDASRAALAEAELKALRAQISPHFIYNALTAIASFISTDPPRARDLVLEFADFTRYSFRRQGEFTTLSEELRSIHSYLELERARFGDRLTVRLRIAPETLATVIPSCRCSRWSRTPSATVSSDARGAVLTVSSIDDGTHTEVIVDDDGVGMDPVELAALLDLDAPLLPRRVAQRRRAPPPAVRPERWPRRRDQPGSRHVGARARAQVAAPARDGPLMSVDVLVADDEGPARCGSSRPCSPPTRACPSCTRRVEGPRLCACSSAARSRSPSSTSTCPASPASIWRTR